MLRNQFRIAWRKLRHNKTESFINLAGLSIGMTAAVLIMLWVQNEVRFDNYHSDVKNIYRITNAIPIGKDETWVWENSPYMLSEKAKEEIPEIAKVALLTPATYNAPIINVNNVLLKEKKAAYVSQDWFSMFKYEFTDGSLADFSQHPYSLIITESAAKRYFGKREPVGQVVKIDTINYQVQAVIKDYPTNTSFRYDMFIPIDAMSQSPKKRENDRQWGNFNYITFIDLKPGASPQQVTKKLTHIMDVNREKNTTKTSLVPLTQIHFDRTVQNSSFVTGNKQTVYIFAIMAVLLLVVACINYVNLTTARASMRAKEVSIKKIVGAPKSSLFGQFLSESLFTSILALLFTVLFVQLCLPFFNRITDQNFQLPVRSVSFWLLIIATLATATILNGIYPALLLSSFKPLSIFRGNSVLKVKDVTLRKVLVVTQFTISVVLIAATLIIFAQLKYIQKQNAGYNRAQIVNFSIPYRVIMPFWNDKEKVQSFQNTIQQELSALAGVEKVTHANESIVDLQSMSGGSADWQGRPKDFDISLSRLEADATFPEVFGLKLVDGRWFRPNEPGEDNNFILNETAVQKMNLNKPYVGQWFKFQGDSGQIIGIVKDFHFRSLHEAITPLVYRGGKGWHSNFFVKISAASVATVIPKMEKIWKSSVSSYPFEYTFLDETFDKLYRAENRTSTLMSFFAGIAIFISCLGLLGLAAFTTERRRKEISIRKVLGASVNSIVGLLSKEFLLLVLIAIVIATPLAWWAMNIWLQDFVYRINISAWIFILAGFFAIAITLIIVGLHGIRAATVNPANNLRSE
ncbi:MAG: ABC transporter permease [Chitinophagaceae bacterium]